MGTVNYARGNLKTVYAVLEDVDQDFWDVEYDIFKQNLREMMEAEFSRNKKITVEIAFGGDNNRSYYGDYVLSVVREYEAGVIEMRCKVVAGYYHGHNLEVDYFLDNEEYDGVENMIDYYRDEIIEMKYKGYSDHQRVPEATMRKDFQRMLNGIEKVYKKISQPLEVQVVFSDGTAVYKRK